MEKTAAVLPAELSFYAEQTLGARISDVRILELTIAHEDHEAETVLRTTRGGTVKHYTHHRDAFPPIMFRTEDILMRGHDIARFDDRTGRGSNELMPLWFYYGADGGFWFGPEWQGSWEMEVHRLPETSRFALRLPYLDFHMLQGEEIKLPPVMIGAWKGDIQDGSNHLRRTIRETIMPETQGHIPTPPAVYQALGGHPAHMAGKGLFDEGSKAAELGAEAFTFASTWMYDRVAKGEERFWWRKMGDVTGVEDIFPDGVRSFAEHLGKEGVRLGLWIDPRIGLDCPVYEDVQDILLHVDPDYEQHLRREYNWLSYVINEAPLIDLSREAGRCYFAGMLDHMVEVNGAEAVWYDLNTDPRAFFFNAHEEPGRGGLLELRYFQGMDAVMREFNRRHPDVWMEICASGGRMINLAVLRYGHSLWITDYTGPDADVIAATRANANTVLPAQCCHKSLYLSKDVKSGDEGFGEENIIAHMIGMFGISQDVMHWPEDVCETVKRGFEAFKEVRHLTNGDFYMLTPQPDSRDAWLVCQYHEPDSGEGVLIAIRLSESREDALELPLRGRAKGDQATFRTVMGSGKAQMTEDGRVRIVFDEGRGALIRYA